MRRLSSSTSSFDPRDGGATDGPAGIVRLPSEPPRHDLRDALVVAAWFAVFLFAADLAVNRLFALPVDPRQKAGALPEYFNYGLSIESKIRRAVRSTDQASAPLMLAGWVDEQVKRNRDRPTAAPGELVVSFYGMSFANDVAHALAELDPKVRLRLFAGPAAPPNHSYAIYERDRGGRSGVVVLAVLGSSVPGLVTNNGMTWRFEGPAPFRYPRYETSGGQLIGNWPAVRSLDDLRQRLSDEAGWNAYTTQLSETDDFYNRLLFRRDFGDRSVLARMVRRAVAQRWQTSQTAQIHGPSGFVDSSPAIGALRQIVTQFAARAKQDGKLPILLLIQDQGYRDHVYRVLEATLRTNQIAFVSTHTICPDTDRRNFVPDGHFTAEANQKIAKALRPLIQTLRNDPG